MTTTSSEQVLITFNSRSTGKRQVTGSATKVYYGYRKRGDEFYVARADMLARPDLFRPVNPEPKLTPTVGLRGGRRPRPAPPQTGPSREVQQMPPQPLPPQPMSYDEDDPHDEPVVDERQPTASLSGDAEIRQIDWGKSLNKKHVQTLYQANVRTLADVKEKGRDGLIAITGIGEKIADTLLAKAAEYDS